MSNKIQFFYEDTTYRIPETDWLYLWLESIFNDENTELGQVEYIICSDDYLLQINKEYLDHDFYTDIITFPLSDDPVEGRLYSYQLTE